jgi:hypothetical protein
MKKNKTSLSVCIIAAENNFISQFCGLNVFEEKKKNKNCRESEIIPTYLSVTQQL